MANLFWVGGTASWNATAGAKWALTSGGVGGAPIPTAADDVFFDAASGSGDCTLAVSQPCRSINFTGYTGTFTHPAAVTLTVGDALGGAGNVALKLVAGMTFVAAATTSVILFASTAVTQQTVAYGGKTVGGQTFNGAGGSWIFQDALNSIGALTHTAGTLNTNGQSVTATVITSTSASARVLTLGASTLTTTGVNSTGFSAATATNLTLNAGTSTINVAQGAQFLSGTTAVGNPLAWNNVVITQTSNASTVGLGAGHTIANLTYNAEATKTARVEFSTDLTITGTLTLVGNSVVNRLLVSSSTPGTPRTVTAAAVVLSNVDFSDIAAAGTAAPWSGSFGDALGNSGITFPAPVTRYAVAAGNTSSTSMWAATSGGAGGASVPLPQDSVVYDANSAAGTYTQDMPRHGRNVTFTGFTRTFSHGVVWTMYGNLTFGSGMTISGANAVTLAGRGTHTITSAGRTWTNTWILNAPGGTYTLTDNFVTSRAANTTLTTGTFNDGGFSLTFPPANHFIMTGGTLNASGTWTFASVSVATVWSVTGTGVVNGAGSTIVFSGVTTSTRTFAGRGGTYGTLTYNVAGSSGALVITGANTFTTLNIGPGRTLTLPASTTTTVTNWLVSGTAGNLVTVNSSTAGTAATLSKASGIVSSDYLSIRDSTATGGASWYAGANSVNVSNNSGWSFTAAPDIAGALTLPVPRVAGTAGTANHVAASLTLPAGRATGTATVAASVSGALAMPALRTAATVTTAAGFLGAARLPLVVVSASIVVVYPPPSTPPPVGVVVREPPTVAVYDRLPWGP